MIDIFYYVHGSTLDNEKKRATGWDQVSLSTKGIEQTQKAALRINSNIYDAIYTSDLIRAVESAEILFANRKDEIRNDQRLRECNYGSFTKKVNIDLIYEEHIDVPFPNGESLKDVEMRMRDFLRDIDNSRYKTIAIVGHRATQLALDVILLKLSWKEAIKRDWRICGHWHLGWHYTYDASQIPF